MGVLIYSYYWQSCTQSKLPVIINRQNNTGTMKHNENRIEKILHLNWQVDRC